MAATRVAICEGPHCLHYTGRSVTDGMAQHGYDEAFCCNCGRHYSVPWVVVTANVPEHGPFFTVRHLQHDEAAKHEIRKGEALSLPRTA